MSRLPTIPEFVSTPEEMSAALRAVKQILEPLAGLRQGDSLGAPQVFVQALEPTLALALSYKAGDFWIDTSTNTLRYWNGTAWQAFA